MRHDRRYHATRYVIELTVAAALLAGAYLYGAHLREQENRVTRMNPETVFLYGKVKKSCKDADNLTRCAYKVLRERDV